MPGIASWVIGIARDSTSLKYELVDLADWPLPMTDEPDIPAYGIYTQEHGFVANFLAGRSGVRRLNWLIPPRIELLLWT